MALLDHFQHAQGTQTPTELIMTGTVYEVWGQSGWASFEVVGESFYTEAIRAIFGPGKLAAEGHALETEVYLVHNHLNVHDANAIEVHSSTGVLGHLSRDDAAQYVGVIKDLQRRGFIATTTARVWAREGIDWHGQAEFVGSVRVDLPEPHMMMPQNPPPAKPHQLLPRGQSIRTTAVDGSAEVTSLHLCAAGEAWVYATIHEVIE